MTLASARRRIAELQHFNAFISLTDEEGEGPVVAVKDMVDVRGTVTTGGGMILPNEPADQDAPVISRMRAAGCVVVGKTNLHEWAFGITSVNPHYGAVVNPHDPGRVAGGSSGGSAVAVATGMCDWALGTDTGGSIRIPASLCGVVGFKPTRGSIPMEGVIPLARSLDTLGPLAPDVATAARAFAIMSGTADDHGRDFPPGRPPRVGVPRGWVRDIDTATALAWTPISHTLPEIDFPDQGALVRVCLTIMFREASEFHRRWLGADPSPYGEDVRDRLIEGLEISEESYRKALEERDRLIGRVAQAMAGWDAILLPTTACVAPLTGDRRAVVEPLTRYTRPFNTTGQPAISLPAPVSGLPVGIQLIGHWGRDTELLRIAAHFEVRR